MQGERTMIRIAILDDEARYLEREKNIAEKYFSKKGLVCTIETFQNAEWFLGGLGEEQFDIYILDVEMPRKTGLEVAREIRKRYPEPVLIFATNFADYAIEAYEVNTYRYIPKEVLEEKLKAALDALLPQILEKEEKYYIIEKKSNVEKIGYTDILYLKKDGRYTVVVHKRGESRVRKSLADMHVELNSPEFIFIDKSVIVNIKHVMGLKDHTVRMRDDARLAVGTTRLGQVRQALTDFWR